MQAHQYQEHVQVCGSIIDAQTSDLKDSNPTSLLFYYSYFDSCGICILVYYKLGFIYVVFAIILTFTNNTVLTKLLRSGNTATLLKISRTGQEIHCLAKLIWQRK